MPEGSIDSIVTDPPYGLSAQPDVAEVMAHWLAGDDYSHRGGGFMGREWDQFVPGPAVWREALRVLKPGGHLVAFGGTRTYDLLALAIRLGGFEVRDQLAWLYGSGMPHGQDVSKAIDKRAGAQPADLAQQWAGWNSALKPALEPVILARKPFAGSLVENVIAHGTGAINVAACAIATEGETVQTRPRSDALHERSDSMGAGWSGQVDTSPRAARFPANVIHDGGPDVLAAFDRFGPKGGGFGVRGSDHGNKMYGSGRGLNRPDTGQIVGFGDEGSAARFFYAAKAAKSERNAGCQHLYWQRDPSQVHGYKLIDQSKWASLPEDQRATGNIHATVKPVALMAWLIRLVTPPGGITCDPFMGSGSSGLAALAEGMAFVGIDLDTTIAQARLWHALAQAAAPSQPKARKAPKAQARQAAALAPLGVAEAQQAAALPRQLAIFGSE